jgi:hypothetical protein
MRVAKCIAIMAASVACASLPKAPPESDAAAKQFVSSPGSARVYVFRLKSVFFGRYDSAIKIDGQDVGSISKELFTFADVAPGRHTVSAFTYLVDGDGVSSCGSGSLTVDMPDAGIYFVNVEVPVTWPVDPPKIAVVPAAAGTAAVLRCRLARK